MKIVRAFREPTLKSGQPDYELHTNRGRSPGYSGVSTANPYFLKFLLKKPAAYAAGLNCQIINL